MSGAVPPHSLLINPNHHQQPPQNTFYNYPANSHPGMGHQSHTSPSSISDNAGTPNSDTAYRSPSLNSNGKRPFSANANEGRKKSRNDDDDDEEAEPASPSHEKAKPTRGSRACMVCRRLKMRCVGGEQGPPCNRCRTGGHECIFEESNRGKRSTKKHEMLSKSLRKMEKTLDTVLKSIGNPTIISGMISRSPSPSDTQAEATRQLISGSASSPPAQSTSRASAQSSSHHRTSSPKLHSLPEDSLNPLGLLAEASLANRRMQGRNDSAIGLATQPGDDPTKVGVASDNYFRPGPMTILPLRRLFIERQVQPEMLSFVDTDEVLDLFNIYFDHMNMHCMLLDRHFHTPALVCSRSPFLLTTICAIASMFYTKKPDLYTRLSDLVKNLAFSVPAQGYKSVEIVQAYLLLSLWGTGAVERYEQDKMWLLLGMGIRMATDLNLHRKTSVASKDTQEGRARDVEVHNRERTWLLCYSLDRSFSAQLGKPHSVKEDYIIRNCDVWCRNTLSTSGDAGLAAYVELQKLMSRSLDLLYSDTETGSGLQTSCDYLLIIKTFESQVSAFHQRWSVIINSKPTEDPSRAAYLAIASQYYVNYAMLVLNSFGLQNALERQPVNIGHFFARCHSCAMTCATLFRDSMAPAGFLKYSPDSHFVQMSYAVLTLLKLVRPEFSAYLERENDTIALVTDVAECLENIAASPSHTPALYGGFLRALISAKAASHAQQLSPSMNGSAPTMHPESLHHEQQQQQQTFSTPGYQDSLFMNDFQFESEMGPALDLNTFPPTMGPPQDESGGLSGLTMDSVLSNGFWDNVLVPGYNNMDGLSGGFLFGVGGSGLITPRLGGTPHQSGRNTPSKGLMDNPSVTESGLPTGMNLSAAFLRSEQSGKSSSA